MRAVSRRFDSVRLGACQRFLLQAHVCMEVHPCALQRFVPQPERDHGAINPMLQKVHGGGVSTNMRGYSLPFKRRAGPRGKMGVLGDATLNRIAAKSAATGAGEERIFGLTVTFP